MAEIILPLGASAEPNTCGSCRFFGRRTEKYSAYAGVCNIELPPMIATKYYVGKESIENSDQFIRTRDRSRCDFQSPDGKVYIVQRRIG